MTDKLIRKRPPNTIGKITCTPGIQAGEPCIAGTRITSYIIAAKVKAGESYEDIIEDYDITEMDIRAAVEYEDTRESERFRATGNGQYSIYTDLNYIVLQDDLNDEDCYFTIEEAKRLVEDLQKAIEYLSNN